MKHELTLDAFIQRLKPKSLTDKRTGKNVQYEVNGAAQAAFAILFMQSGSFLAGQRHLRQAKGKSNAKTVFQMERIPTDTHIRNLLDPVNPNEFNDEFRFLLTQLAESGQLSQWYVLDDRLAFSLEAHTISPPRIFLAQSVRSANMNTAQSTCTALLHR
jgi:hypothetical protein